MATTVTLAISARQPKQSLGVATHIPAVVYGKQQESTPITLDRKEFSRVYEQAGESTIIVLTGLDEDIEVLVQDVAFDPVKNRVQHVDFYAFERGKELTTNVPLTFVGTPPAEDADGILTKVLHEVEVSCRPSALPHDITVDVSTLTDLDSQITIADLVLPEGVRVTHDPEDIVASIVAAKDEAEETEAVSIDDVEVEQKGKDETNDTAEAA